jgi:ferritin-like metal-binding protein YciE
MQISTPEEKFQHEVGDIYDAEHRFLEAQRLMLEQASDQALKTMIQEHIRETEGQIQNIEQIYQHLGQKPKRVKCPAAAGLVEEGRKTMEEAASPQIRDCIISAAQAKVEHYEVASYRTLLMGAEGMGQQEIVKLIKQNLKQEEQTAKKVEASAPELLQKAMGSQANRK